MVPGTGTGQAAQLLTFQTNNHKEEVMREMQEKKDGTSSEYCNKKLYHELESKHHRVLTLRIHTDVMNNISSPSVRVTFLSCRDL